MSPIKLYVSATAPPKNISELNDHRRFSELCDVTLVVGEKQFHAHRKVLAGVCPYFRAMFGPDFLEANTREVTMKEVDEAAIEAVVDFIYTSRMQIEENNVQNIFQVAHLLELDEVRSWCCDFLREQLDPTNCIGIADFAETYLCKELVISANIYTREHFLSVVKCEEFLMIPFSRLEDILNWERFYVASEADLYSALIAWVKYNVGERKQYLARVLSHVRFPLLGIEFLEEAVATDLLVRESKQCCDLLESAQKYLEEVQTRPKATHGLLAVGLHYYSQCAMVDSLDLYPADWRKVAAMPDAIHTVRDAVAVGNTVYVIDAQRKMAAYDVTANEWRVCTTHVLCSESARMVAVGEELFLMGNSQMGTSFRLYKYDHAADEWLHVSSTMGSRINFSLVALNGEIYMLGGETKSDDPNQSYPENKIDAFDPSTGVCSFLHTFIPTAPTNMGATVLGQRIYLAGGTEYYMHDPEVYDYHSYEHNSYDSDSVRSYDPEHNQWFACGDLAAPRANATLVVLNAQLYVVGGTTNCMERLDSVERYDVTTKHWTACRGIKLPYFGGAKCVVVALPEHYARLERCSSANKSASRVDFSHVRKTGSPTWFQPASCDTWQHSTPEDASSPDPQSDASSLDPQSDTEESQD